MEEVSSFEDTQDDSSSSCAPRKRPGWRKCEMIAGICQPLIWGLGKDIVLTAFRNSYILHWGSWWVLRTLSTGRQFRYFSNAPALKIWFVFCYTKCIWRNLLLVRSQGLSKIYEAEIFFTVDIQHWRVRLNSKLVTSFLFLKLEIRFS